MADAGLMMGRSFRVGWGPNWTLAHSGFQISHSTNSKLFGLFSAASNYPGDGEGLPLRVVVEQVCIGAPERPSNAPKQVCNKLIIPVVKIENNQVLQCILIFLVSRACLRCS